MIMCGLLFCCDAWMDGCVVLLLLLQRLTEMVGREFVGGSVGARWLSSTAGVAYMCHVGGTQSHLLAFPIIPNGMYQYLLSLLIGLLEF